MNEPLVVWLVLYGDVVILRHGGGIEGIYFQQTIQRHKRQIQYLVVAEGETLYQVYPYNPVCIDEKIGAAETYRTELTEKQECAQIEEHTVHKDVVAVADFSEFVDIAEQKYSGEQSLEIADTQHGARAEVHAEICLHPEFGRRHDIVYHQEYQRLQDGDMEEVYHIGNGEYRHHYVFVELPVDDEIHRYVCQ